MDKINDLSQTVELMVSQDYKKRFIAEYAQIEIRTKRLERVIKSIKDNTCTFTPICDIEILESQYKTMNDYRETLILRASIEEIKLPEVYI